MEKEQVIHNLAKRSIKLKNVATDFKIPKDRQRKAIRLWITTLFSLKKEVRSLNKGEQ
jgi:hypothetical protein